MTLRRSNLGSVAHKRIFWWYFEPESKSFFCLHCKFLQPAHAPPRVERCLPAAAVSNVAKCASLAPSLAQTLTQCNDYEASTTSNGAGAPFRFRSVGWRRRGDACIAQGGTCTLVNRSPGRRREIRLLRYREYDRNDIIFLRSSS